MANILSAEWLNERMINVLAMVDKTLDRVLFEGILSSGYLPGEQPLTPGLLERMTAQEVAQLLNEQTDPGKRLAIMRALDIEVPEEIS